MRNKLSRGKVHGGLSTAMFRGYRFAAIAIGLAFVSPPQHAWAQKNERDPVQEIKIPAPPFGLLENPEEPNRTAEPCAEGEDKRYSDLCAQWKAADAAKESADWTRRGFWLSLAEAITGVLTLIAAIAAAAYARRAAIAASDAVEEGKNATAAADAAVAETRRIGEAQVRAYLGIDYCRLERIGDDTFRLDVGIKNSGQSPARNVTSDARVSVTLRFNSHATQQSFRRVPRQEGGMLLNGTRDIYKNRSHFPYVAAGGTIEMTKELVLADGMSFVRAEGETVEADFTFMIGLNFTDVFDAIFQENHAWRARNYAPISIGDLILSSPAFDIPDTTEHFDTYKPSGNQHR